jgi:hypothetical protein
MAVLLDVNLTLESNGPPQNRQPQAIVPMLAGADNDDNVT